MPRRTINDESDSDSMDCDASEHDDDPDYQPSSSNGARQGAHPRRAHNSAGQGITMSSGSVARVVMQAPAASAASSKSSGKRRVTDAACKPPSAAQQAAQQAASKAAKIARLAAAAIVELPPETRTHAKAAEETQGKSIAQATTDLVGEFAAAMGPIAAKMVALQYGAKGLSDSMVDVLRSQVNSVEQRVAELRSQLEEASHENARLEAQVVAEAATVEQLRAAEAGRAEADRAAAEELETARAAVRQAEESAENTRATFAAIQEENARELARADRAVQAALQERRNAEANLEVAQRNVSALGQQLAASLPDKCWQCNECIGMFDEETRDTLRAVYCNLDPERETQPHATCGTCLQMQLDIYTHPRSKAEAWVTNSQGICCRAPHCPHGHVSFSDNDLTYVGLSTAKRLTYLADKAAFDKSREMQRALEEAQERARRAENGEAIVDLAQAQRERLERASIPCCPNPECKLPGSVDNACLAIRCEVTRADGSHLAGCNTTYCGWCFAYHSRDPANRGRDIHEHVRRCPRNRLYTQRNLATYNNEDRELYAQHFKEEQEARKAAEAEAMKAELEALQAAIKPLEMAPAEFVNETGATAA